jgi:predicted Zn-dependent protease|tara:strand:+ start:999 stop:1184 length:186 start_codon:yes stop_codon:yes gene_type:complete
VRLKELKNVYKTKVSKRMVKTNEGNIYTQGVDDAHKVSALVKQIKELKEEVKFWKKLSRRL